MTKLLITGASGLLGANLVLGTAREYQVTAICHTKTIRYDDVQVMTADLSERETAIALIQRCSPEWVIHCAAETNVDRCQEDPALAFKMNRDMARWIAQATRSSGAYLIHVSTDAVFGGRGEGYVEGDDPQPINVYGQSKLEGERAVLDEDPEAVIVRTNFYGWNAKNKSSLAEWFLSHLERKEPCPGFTDVYVKLMLVNQLIDIFLRILERELSGIFHVVGGDCVSKYAFGVRLAQVFGLESDLIEPASVDEGEVKAPRSRNLCLDTTKIESTLGMRMPSLDSGIHQFNELRQNGYEKRIKSLIGEQSHEGN
jgi:dTDP-4-dehydrorhamnose reductase